MKLKLCLSYKNDGKMLSITVISMECRPYYKELRNVCRTQLGACPSISCHFQAQACHLETTNIRLIRRQLAMIVRWDHLLVIAICGGCWHTQSPIQQVWNYQQRIGVVLLHVLNNFLNPPSINAVYHYLILKNCVPLYNFFLKLVYLIYKLNQII